MNMNKHENNSSSSQPHQGDENLVNNLLDRLVDAWNHHDANAFASILKEDGEWTDVMGQSAI
jgi:uncharacterized protein (TIGR02246 family)